jgi:hypothetical protein
MSFDNTVFIRAVIFGHILAIVSGAIGLHLTTMVAFLENTRG